MMRLPSTASTWPRRICAVGPHDLDELVVADAVGVLGDEQRSGDARDGRVLDREQARPSARRHSSASAVADRAVRASARGRHLVVGPAPHPGHLVQRRHSGERVDRYAAR